MRYAQNQTDLMLVSECISALESIKLHLLPIDPNGGNPCVDEDYKIAGHRFDMEKLETLLATLQNLEPLAHEIYKGLHAAHRNPGN